MPNVFQQSRQKKDWLKTWQKKIWKNKRQVREKTNKKLGYKFATQKKLANIKGKMVKHLLAK